MKMEKWVTVTLNPAIDLSVQAENFSTNQVNTVKEVHRYAAGKGINVARVMFDLGSPVILTGFLALDNRELFDEMFLELGLDEQFVPVQGHNRTNIKVHDSSGETTDLNFNGFSVTSGDIEKLHNKLINLANVSDGFIFSGSLPENLDEKVVVDWMYDLKRLGKKVVLDSSKQMLCAGVTIKPWLIKPNEREVSELLGRRVGTIEEGICAARELVDSGIDNVLLSMGEKGLIWSSVSEVLIATPPKVQLVSTVGAGDSVVAGFCWASQLGDREQQIATATALGALSVSQTGVGVPSMALFDELRKRVSVRAFC